jgi:hypothetical protein
MRDERIAAPSGTNGRFAVSGNIGTAKSDARKLLRTGTPGIYRKGTRYVVVYNAGGRQRKEFARTLAQARKIKTRGSQTTLAASFRSGPRSAFASSSQTGSTGTRAQAAAGFARTHGTSTGDYSVTTPTATSASACGSWT